MKKTALVTVVALSILVWPWLEPDTAFSQIDVTGTILDRVKWTAESNPYVLSGDIVVENGGSLIIERDVVVNFAPGATLRVKGQLDAYRVFFNGGLNANNQETLTFLPGSSGSLTRCAFLDLSLVCNASDMRLTSSVVTNRNGTGITVGSEVDPHIADTSFHGNSYFAVYRSGKDPLDIKNCYWGSEKGPSSEGPAYGDKVGSNIVFRPFRTKENISFLILAKTSMDIMEDQSGKTIQFKYSLFNLNTFDHEAVLGASLVGEGHRVYSHPESDINATISPGFHELTRVFELPVDAKDGVYDIHWGVMTKNLSRYHAYVRKYGVVEIQGEHLREVENNPSMNGEDG